MTPTRCRATVAYAPLLLSLCVSLVSTSAHAAQQERNRQVVLTEIVLHTSTLSAEEMTVEIERALTSSDAHLREFALAALASRAGGPRFSREPHVRAHWLTDHTWVQRFRPALIQALQDPARAVRAQAVMTLGNYEFELDKPYAFRPDTVRVFTDHYYQEQDQRIRTEILKAFALGDTTSSIDQVVGDTLRDEAPAVRQYAVRAARKLDPSRAGALLVRALHDPDTRVKSAAASSLGTFGRRVASVAQAVEDALLREPDPEVRAALKGALEAITGKNAR